MKKVFIIFVSLMVCVILLCGCTSTATSSAAPSSSAPASTTTTSANTPSATTTTSQLPPIKIGHIVDLTGPEAMMGKKCQSTLDFAFQTINYQVLGRQIQIIVGDAQGNPSNAVDVARKMVENDKVAAIFGPTQIGEKMAVASYLKQVGMPEIIYNNSPMAIFAGQNKWIFGVGGSALQCPTCIADYIYNHLGYRTIDTLSQDNDGGRSFINPITDYFTKLGGKVIQQQWVPVPCQDFAPYLATLKTADAFIVWDTGSDAIALLTQFHELGIDKKMPLIAAFNGGIFDASIVSALPSADAAAVVGDLAPMTYAPDSQDPINLSFIKAFTAKMGFPPPDESYSGPYQAALAFVEALKATGGDTTPAVLANALATINVIGPEGVTSFTGGLLVSNKNVYIGKVVQNLNSPNRYEYSTVYTYNNVPPTGYTGK